MRPTRALIDLEALRRNLERVREAAPGRQVMAIIKADGYGHGLCRVAHALAGADAPPGPRSGFLQPPRALSGLAGSPKPSVDP